MGRLIDADALLDRIPNLYERREVSRWVDEAPTVDAVPVRYGHWIYHPDWQEDGECGYECSECLRGVDVDYAYCPNCGAKMNEEDDKWLSSTKVLFVKTVKSL